MSLQEETRRAVKSLGQSELSTEWVDRVWDDNFCESYDLPCDELLNCEGWASLVEALVQWKNRRDDEETDSDSEEGVLKL